MSLIEILNLGTVGCIVLAIIYYFFNKRL